MTAILPKKSMFTIQETAEILTISRAGVYRLIDIDKLKRVEVLQSGRITRESIKAYLNSL